MFSRNSKQIAGSVPETGSPTQPASPAQSTLAAVNDAVANIKTSVQQLRESSDNINITPLLSETATGRPLDQKSSLPQSKLVLPQNSRQPSNQQINVAPLAAPPSSAVVNLDDDDIDQLLDKSKSQSTKESKLNEPVNQNVLKSHAYDDDDDEDDSLLGKKKSGSKDEKDPKKKKQQSQNSLGSSTTNNRMSNAREVSETYSTKLVGMIWVFLSLIVNIVLFYYLVQMQNGLDLPIPVTSVSTVGTVIIEILLLLSNVMTFKALNDGASAFFGQRLSEKKGYSIAVVGFIQASAISKYSYCNQLSLNSTCRRFLSRISFIWIFLELINILSPFAATSISGTSSRMDDGTVNCIEFHETGTPVDRGWPTAETEEGYAELIFGTALGQVRSENSSLSVTTGIMAPQIVGAVQDGDTLAGLGYTTDIFTNCQCTRGKSTAYIQELAPHVSTVDANAMLTQFNAAIDIGMVNHLTTNTSGAYVTTLMTNLALCGGTNTSFIQQCVTSFTNHKEANVLISYMTDGTPASIAAKTVSIRNVIGDGDITWMNQAVTNILELNGQATPVSSIKLPQTVAGVTNPLLWWTTPNLIMVDLSLLEPGLETTFAMLLRAGMQRSFAVRGNTCVKNVAVEGLSTVKMTTYGINIVCVVLGFQLLVVLISFLAFVPWILSQDPIAPCIRALKDNIYFSTLLNSSGINTGFFELCNAPSHAMWQAIDVIARIGETVQTVSEEIGHIGLEKPKLIRKLVNGKKYY